MANRKRTRGSHFRKGRAPGKSFWIRTPPTSLTQQASASGVFSDLILTEDDFADPNLELNDTKKGAPVVERMIVKLGYSQVVDADYFNPADFAQVTMLVEGMLFSQSDQFVVIVDSTTTFDTTLRNQRIMGYGVMPWSQMNDARQTRIHISTEITFEPRSRIALREKALGVAIRTNMNLANDAILATSNFFQSTILLRVP